MHFSIRMLYIERNLLDTSALTVNSHCILIYVWCLPFSCFSLVFFQLLMLTYIRRLGLSKFKFLLLNPNERLFDTLAVMVNWQCILISVITCLKIMWSLVPDKFTVLSFLEALEDTVSGVSESDDSRSQMRTEREPMDEGQWCKLFQHFSCWTLRIQH